MDKEIRYFLGFKPAVIYPLAFSIATGGLIGLVSFFIALSGIPNPGRFAGLIGSIAAALTWFYLLSIWLSRVFPIKKPMKKYTTDIARVELYSDNGRQVDIAELPAPPEKLTILANGLIEGETFSEGSWSGPDTPFTRGQFRRLRNVMIANGLCEWRNSDSPSQGLVLTYPGWATMRYYANLSPALDMKHPQNAVSPGVRVRACAPGNGKSGAANTGSPQSNE